LDDSFFEGCLEMLNSYVQGKDIPQIESPACIAGLTVLGEEGQSLFFSFNNSGLTDADVDPNQVNYDLKEEDDQTFWNFAFALESEEGIALADSSDCGCGDDEDDDIFV